MEIVALKNWGTNELEVSSLATEITDKKNQPRDKFPQTALY